MTRVLNAVYQRSGEHTKDIPLDAILEVAIVGRSNVGKSTFINRLTGRNGLARVSKTPGATKQINAFLVELQGHQPIRLLDLPGFGFAQVSKTDARRLEGQIRSVIEEREELSLLLLLNDIRRSPQEEELWVRDVAFERDVRIQVVLTKVDKLSKNEQKKCIAERANDYGLSSEDFLLAGEKISVKPIWDRVLGIVDS